MSSSYQKTLDWLSSLTLPRKDERHSYGRRRRLVEHRIYRLRYFAIIIIIRLFYFSLCFSRLRDLFSLELFIFSAVTEEQLSMSVSPVSNSLLFVTIVQIFVLILLIRLVCGTTSVDTGLGFSFKHNSETLSKQKKNM